MATLFLAHSNAQNNHKASHFSQLHTSSHIEMFMKVQLKVPKSHADLVLTFVVDWRNFNWQ